MRDGVQGDELARTRLERDLFRRLLDLGFQTQLEPFLKEALSLVVDVAGARQGYLELHDLQVDSEPSWSIANGFSVDELDEIRSKVSQGIIAEALSTGQTINTPSALRDPRFLERKSVRIERIVAVLCVPIGANPPRGALYLQGREPNGSFTEEDRERAEIFARHLAPLVDNILTRRRTSEAVDPTAPYRASLRIEAVVGSSSALATLFHDVALVAPLEVSVLLTGDTGTGKSQIAHLIHDNGPRSSGPLVEVNCAALPEGLVESELFGARAGSHSTSHSATLGKVEAARGGTLFLDEVGDLPIGAQAKLLQLLQTRSFYPLGASERVFADVRMIAATNVDLEKSVADGLFREDLFYRLQVLPIRVPSLAERRCDIVELARFFCARACELHRLPRIELTGGAERTLEALEWPGNVRQLENTVAAGAIRAAGSGAHSVERSHLYPHTAESRKDPAEEALTFQEATSRFQIGLLQQVLEETGWNVAETARRLDIARSYVYKLIRVFGLSRCGKSL